MEESHKVQSVRAVVEQTIRDLKCFKIMCRNKIKAVAEFEQAGGLLGVRHLADRIGLSSRQFERRFRSAVGISPKLFCRMQRFQRVFPAMENTQSQWVDAAVNCGYYDQAHLIRDFREFSGTTPTALLTEEFDLARHFVQQSAMSHFSNTTRTARRRLR